MCILSGQNHARKRLQAVSAAPAKQQAQRASGPGERGRPGEGNARELLDAASQFGTDADVLAVTYHLGMTHDGERMLFDNLDLAIKYVMHNQRVSGVQHASAL